MQAYLKIGLEALKDKRKGEPKELLNKSEKMEIIEIVKTTSPQKYGYQTAYWTTGILGDFIEEKYDIKYKSKTSYYLIFRQAKFSYHKPGNVYEKHDEKRAKEWRKKTKPILKYFKDASTLYPFL